MNTIYMNKNTKKDKKKDKKKDSSTKKRGGFHNKEVKRRVDLIEIKRELDNIDIQNLTYALNNIIRMSKDRIETVLEMKTDKDAINDMYNDYGVVDLTEYIRKTIELTYNMNGLYTYIVAV